MVDEAKKLKVIVGGIYMTPRGEKVVVNRLRFQFAYVTEVATGSQFSIKRSALIEVEAPSR